MSFRWDCTSYPREISWHCHQKLYVLYTCSLLTLLNVKFIQITCTSFIAQPKWWRKKLVSLGLHDSLISHSSLQFAHCLLCSHCFHTLLKLSSSQWLPIPQSDCPNIKNSWLFSCFILYDLRSSYGQNKIKRWNPSSSFN